MSNLKLFLVVTVLCLSACTRDYPYVGSRVDADPPQCVPGSSECTANMGSYEFRYSVTTNAAGHLLEGVVLPLPAPTPLTDRANTTLIIQGHLFLVHTGLIVDTVPFELSGQHDSPLSFRKQFITASKFQTAFIGQHYGHVSQ